MKMSMLTNPLELSGIICNLLSSAPSWIIFPTNANNFNFNPGMISLLPKFDGLDSENPYQHLKEFEEVCSTFHDQSCNEETIGLKLFPFLLKTRQKLGLILWDLGQLVLGKRCKLSFQRNFFQFIRLMHLKENNDFFTKR